MTTSDSFLEPMEAAWQALQRADQAVRIFRGGRGTQDALKQVIRERDAARAAFQSYCTDTNLGALLLLARMKVGREKPKAPAETDPQQETPDDQT